MIGRMGRERWIVGLTVVRGEGHGALVRRTSSGPRLERTAHVDWSGEEDLADLRRLLREAAPGIRPNRICLAFLPCGGPLTIEVKSFPAMHSDDFDMAAEWYQKGNRRTRIAEPCFGRWLQEATGEGPAPAEREGILLETESALIDGLLDLGRRAGVARSVVVPQPFALSALASHYLPGTDTVLLLSEGESEPYLTAVAGNRLLLHRAIDLSPDPFEDTSLEEEEGGTSAAHVVGVLTGTQTSLSALKLQTELERTAHYLQSRFDVAPKAVLLPTPHLELEHAIPRATELPVQILAESVEPGREWERAGLLAYGAALRAASEVQIGALPLPRRKKRQLTFSPRIRLPRIPLRRAVGIALPVLLLAFGLMQGGRYLITKRNGEEAARLETLSRQTVDPDLERRLARWERQALVLNRVRSAQYLWSELFRELSVSLPPGVRVDDVEGSVPRNEKIELSDLDPDYSGGNESFWAYSGEGADEEEAPPVFSIRGKAPGLAEVRSIIERLEKSPAFGKVTLSTAALDGEDGDRGGGPIRFELLCEPLVERGAMGDAGDLPS